MEDLFVCPLCKISFPHKARLRKHVNKHIKKMEKRLAQAADMKRAEQERIAINERIKRTGSCFKNDTERNKYFAMRRTESPIYDMEEPHSTVGFIVSGGAFGLGKSRKN